MLPTLRQLQYLKLLAEHGSFGRAADAAHVTQPTLSSGIQELERTLGAPVVDRARSGVILTAVGEEALRRATVILNETEELVEAGHDPELVDRVVRMVDRAEYKRRQYPPGPKITAKNFGRDRRLPITSRWREPRRSG